MTPTERTILTLIDSTILSVWEDAIFSGDWPFSWELDDEGFTITARVQEGRSSVDLYYGSIKLATSPVVLGDSGWKLDISNLRARWKEWCAWTSERRMQEERRIREISQIVDRLEEEFPTCVRLTSQPGVVYVHTWEVRVMSKDLAVLCRREDSSSARRVRVDMLHELIVELHRNHRTMQEFYPRA